VDINNPLLSRDGKRRCVGGRGREKDGRETGGGEKGAGRKEEWEEEYVYMRERERERSENASE
jgi:hypothetical protein